MLNYSYQAKRYLVALRRGLRWWPWLVSIGVHAVVLVVLSAVVFISFSQRDDRPEIVPEARLGKIDPRLPLFYRDRNPQPLMPDSLLNRQLEQQFTDKAASDALHDDTLDLIAIRRAAGSDEQLRNVGSVATAPKTRLFNAHGNAYSVVYVVDRSASMFETIEPLKRELKRSLAELKPMQKFHVIFFSAGRPIEGAARRLTWASDRHKRQAFEFIDGIVAEGKTDPQWAVKRALELDPDLVYLLTDGVFDEAIADQIIAWGQARKVKINTIAYVWERGGVLLRRIAERTGGVYRFVSEEQLEW